MHESCSVPNFSSSLVSRPIGTTEGQTVYITWRATSRLSIEHPGTQPFTIPGPQPSPKEDALPNSTQVRLQVFSTTAFVMFYFKCVEFECSLFISFSIHKWTQLALFSYRQNSRIRPLSPSAMKLRPPSPQPASAKPPPIQKPALTPTGAPTLRKRDSKSKDLCPVQAVSPQTSDSNKTKEKNGEQFTMI